MLTFYLFMLFKEVYKIKLNPQRTMRVLPDRQSQARGGGGSGLGHPPATAFARTTQPDGLGSGRSATLTCRAIPARRSPLSSPFFEESPC